MGIHFVDCSQSSRSLPDCHLGVANEVVECPEHNWEDTHIGHDTVSSVVWAFRVCRISPSRSGECPLPQRLCSEPFPSPAV